MSNSQLGAALRLARAGRQAIPGKPVQRYYLVLRKHAQLIYDSIHKWQLPQNQIARKVGLSRQGLVVLFEKMTEVGDQVIDQAVKTGDWTAVEDKLFENFKDFRSLPFYQRLQATLRGEPLPVEKKKPGPKPGSKRKAAAAAGRAPKTVPPEKPKEQPADSIDPTGTESPEGQGTPTAAPVPNESAPSDQAAAETAVASPSATVSVTVPPDRPAPAAVPPAQRRDNPLRRPKAEVAQQLSQEYQSAQRGGS